jgi:hypothetical protein
MEYIKYLISTLIGITIGAYVYSHYTQSSTLEVQPSTKAIQAATPEKTQQTTLTPLKSSGINYEQLLKDKDLQIATLKTEIELLKISNIENQADENKPTIMTKPMTMDDFGKNMISSMMKDIKNVIIEPSEDEAADLRKSFAEEDTFAEDAIKRTDEIHNYLQSINENNQFYIDNLECGIKICQLEVTTNDTEKWPASYASLVSQDWFNNITMKEKSDDPNKFIYFIINNQIDANNMN